MDISSDYRDLLKILNEHKVKYLIVGAYAVVYYSQPRFTKDLDLWISPDPENANRLFKALKGFGAPLKSMSPKDFANKNLIYQVGVAPIRVDFIMDIAHLDFEKAWRSRIKSKYADIPINILGLKELVKSKQAANRPQDVIDLKELKTTSRRNIKI